MTMLRCADIWNLLHSNSCYRSIAGRNRFTKQEPASSFRGTRLRVNPESRDSGFDAAHRPGMTAQTESTSMSKGLIDLISILDLEPIEVNLFRGNSPKTSWQRVFGG